jgi:hypothetical protein
MVALRHLLPSIVVLCVLVCVSSVLADCYMTNGCDSNRTGRDSPVQSSLIGQYQRAAAQTGKTADSCPGALFFFSQGNTPLANQLLRTCVLAPFSNRDKVYIAWTRAQYSSLLDSSVVLPSFSPSGVSDEYFASLAASYLQSNSSQNLIATLRDRGSQGWYGLEQDPERLGTIVIALLALYDRAQDPTIRKLAEMHLDVLFTRLASLGVNGGFAGPLVGDMDAMYDMESTPWFTWHYELFDGGLSSGRIVRGEPSLLLAHYCPTVPTKAAIGVSRRVEEPLPTSGNARLVTYVNTSSDYAIGAAEDTGPYFSPSGYVTKALLRFNNDPQAFVELSTRTTNERTAAQSTDAARTLLFNDRVLVGNLSGDSCNEPHALFGKPFSFEPLPSGKGVVFSSSDNYGLLRFLGPASQASVTERYANRSNYLPLWLTKPRDGEPGQVVFPNTSVAQSGVFSLEIIPSSFASDCAGELDCLASAAEGNTSLTVTGGVISYRSNLAGAVKTYNYTPSSGAAVPAPVTSGKPLTYVRGDTLDIMLNNGNAWTLRSAAAGVSLDFNAALASMKSVNGALEDYACEVENLPGQSNTSFSALGLVAATFMKYYKDETEYVIDCAPYATNALPNPLVDQKDENITGSCVIAAGGKRSVVLIYKSDGNVKKILSNTNLYYPFNPVGYTPVDIQLCNTTLVNTIGNDDFEQCGSVSVTNGKLYFWVNGKNKILLISIDDSNPFTDGWLSGLGDWWRSLFGPLIVQGAGVDASRLGMIKAGYFYHSKGSFDKNVRGIVETTNGQASVLYQNFSASVTPFTDSLTPKPTYSASGKTQVVKFTPNEFGPTSSWALLTRRLRVDTSGGGHEFTASCNGTPISTWPECDNPGGIVGSCQTGDTTKKVRCNSTCALDTSACGTCADLDKDGYYNDASCGAHGEVDCYDASPNATFFMAGGLLKRCDSVVAGTGYDGGPCASPNASICPQCRNPGRTSDPCDGVDNQCHIPPQSDNCGTSSDEQTGSFSCTTTPDASCPWVCGVNVTVTPPTDSYVLTDVTFQEGGSCSVPLGSYIHGGRYCTIPINLCGQQKLFSTLTANDDVVTNITYLMKESESCQTQDGWSERNKFVRSDHPPNDRSPDYSHQSLKLCVQKKKASEVQESQIVKTARFSNCVYQTSCCPGTYIQTSYDSYGGNYCVDNIDMCVSYEAVPVPSPTYTACVSQCETNRQSCLSSTSCISYATSLGGSSCSSPLDSQCQSYACGFDPANCCCEDTYSSCVAGC